jgi:hypothetical protein
VDHCERFETERHRVTAWDSRPGFVCSEEVVGDEMLSGFPLKSWSYITVDEVKSVLLDLDSRSRGY